jgi:peptidoglycan/xylan/chitin deacetylase (PgdA/CDA1 family)
MAPTRWAGRKPALAAALTLLILVSCGEPATEGDGAGPVDGAAGRPAAPTEQATATIVPPGTEPEPAIPEPEAPGEASPPAEPAPEPTAPAPPPGLPPGLLGQDIERIPTTSRVVALTFDAGANADAVQSILATLAAEKVPGTFFLTGDFVGRFPGASQSIRTAGHRLANHSVNHPAFTSLTGSEIRAEVRGAEEDIRAVTGGDPRPFFRFPFGDRDARTIAAVNDLGYLAVRWTVDTLGWQGTSGGRSVAEVTQRVLDTARPGQIVLMHVGSHPTDGSTLDADALPDVISGLRAEGYRFVTLDALLTAGS